MPFINTLNFTNVLDEESEKVWQDETISRDTKLICRWLYLVCKILLVLKGIG